MSEAERDLLVVVACILRDQLTDRLEANASGDNWDRADLDALVDAIEAVTGRAHPGDNP